MILKFLKGLLLLNWVLIRFLSVVRGFWFFTLNGQSSVFNYLSSDHLGIFAILFREFFFWTVFFPDLYQLLLSFCFFFFCSFILNFPFHLLRFTTFVFSSLFLCPGFSSVLLFWTLLWTFWAFVRNFSVHLDHLWILIVCWFSAIFLTSPYRFRVWKDSFDFRFFRLVFLQAFVSARAPDLFRF